MPRNLISQIAYDAEPMLGEVKSAPARRTWLPVLVMEVPVDTARWQTRAAPWNRGGKVSTRRQAH
jgi:hypothetical protein